MNFNVYDICFMKGFTMTDSHRNYLANELQVNGISDNPWWINAVVYQIYPRSFQDSNGDGVGDIKGIISKLDYIANLGADVIWLNPVYKSPQDDNGYDISDYQDIDPLFGTLDDLDELIYQSHRRGIRIIMDLVVNHTSDEHSWFQASRNPQDPRADWYWWRPARSGYVPGEPGAEPNKWGSYFGGSAWTYDTLRKEYFLHQYSAKQPDLNWNNPEVRRAIYSMMNWWMDRGINGFRMDVITQISKITDESGHLPGEEGSAIPDLPAGDDGYSSPFPFCSDGPRLDEFLHEMRCEVFANRDGYLVVGEAPGISASRNQFITDPKHNELDMLFLFDHVEVDCSNGTKWNPKPLYLPDLKKCMTKQQEAVSCRGWTSLYFNNHDQPRIVSRWGDDKSVDSVAKSAKALALLLHMHRGTPYIFQGEELGMTNAHFNSLSQYRDLEALNMYHQRVEQAGIQSPQSMLEALGRRARDNSRTPMQWDASPYAGFTWRGATEPWISVNSNYLEINASSQINDDDSVYNFYRRLIHLRHAQPIVATGDWNLLDASDLNVYSFTRSLNNEKLLVIVNLSKETSLVPKETITLLRNAWLSKKSTCSNLDCLDMANSMPLLSSKILISTYNKSHAVHSLVRECLSPWEGIAIML